jgi:hypothetical protein
MVNSPDLAAIPAPMPRMSRGRALVSIPHSRDKSRSSRRQPFVKDWSNVTDRFGASVFKSSAWTGRVLMRMVSRGRGYVTPSSSGSVPSDYTHAPTHAREAQRRASTSHRRTSGPNGSNVSRLESQCGECRTSDARLGGGENEISHRVEHVSQLGVPEMLAGLAGFVASHFKLEEDALCGGSDSVELFVEAVEHDANNVTVNGLMHRS